MDKCDKCVGEDNSPPFLGESSSPVLPFDQTLIRIQADVRSRSV